MSIVRNEIFQNALQLEEDDRVQLAGLLLSHSADPADPGWEDAWKREMDRRAGELDSGSVKAVPWEEVRARLTRKLDADSPH